MAKLDLDELTLSKERDDELLQESYEEQKLHSDYDYAYGKLVLESPQLVEAQELLTLLVDKMSQYGWTIEFDDLVEELKEM